MITFIANKIRLQFDSGQQIWRRSSIDCLLHEIEVLQIVLEHTARIGLLHLMQQISEELWGTGWLEHLDERLEDLLVRDDPDIQPYKIELKLLHNEAHGWWQWSDKDGKEIFIRDE